MHQQPPIKRPFYKYASPDTTLAILRSRQVRYSSPLSFNDPFDVQTGLHIDFDCDALLEKVLDRLNQLATAPEEPLVDPEDPWGKIVLEVRKRYPIYGFPRIWMQETFADDFAKLVSQFRATQQQIQQHWRSVLLPSVRVFCVSEERDNLLMWAHYAKDHTGTVFEFWSLPEEDNPLSVAGAVNYVKRPPPFFSEKEFLDDLLSINKMDPKALSRRYVYAKSEHWSYEREWRVWYPLSATKSHDDMPIRESEFVSLYIGCRASSDFRDEVLRLLRKEYPSVKVFEAQKEEDAYALTYTAV